MSLSESIGEEAARIVRRYPVARSALLPLLHLCQAEQGCVTDEAIGFCAEVLGLTRAEVSAVESFYTMFKHEPVGDWLLSVCTNPPCKLAGGREIHAGWRERLGGERDPDAGVSLEEVECLGCCDAAPVAQVNYEMYGPLTAEGADELLDSVVAGSPHASGWSGERPRSFREISRALSGIDDGLDGVWAQAARQQIEDYERPPARRTGEADLPVTGPGGDPGGIGGQAFRAAGGAAPGALLGDGRADGPAGGSMVADAAAEAADEAGGGGPDTAGGPPTDEAVGTASRESDDGPASSAPAGAAGVGEPGHIPDGLTFRYRIEGAHRLETYEAHGGYEGARRALQTEPDELVQRMKDSGLRGRGGAGFPTGVKWSFMATDTGQPGYVVANADEGEPGTFKDRELMERDPHSVIEGMIVAGRAMQADYGWLYLRGEFTRVGRRMAEAVKEAYDAGYLGDDIFGTGQRFHLMLHRGAGAYICGEETALLDSLEGRRGQPRLRPPFPATHGVYGCPTTVNNVETLAAAAHIARHGPQWFTQWGSEQSPGTKLVCISGEVARPGNYEFPMATPVEEMIAAAGGMADGRALKFWCPGGSSTPYLAADDVDVPFTFEDIKDRGSLLGTGGLMLFSEQTCVVETTLRFTRFYEHESCGKCTPCREGTYWLSQVLDRIERGQGRPEDLELLRDVCDNMFGRNFCALGDGATSPIVSSVELFRGEYEAHIDQGRCPLGAGPPGPARPVLATAQADRGQQVAPAGMARPTAPAQDGLEATRDGAPGGEADADVGEDQPS